MNNDKTHYLILLDKSGSMQDSKQKAIASFNEQLETIQQLQTDFPEQKFKLSLVSFNQEVESLFFNMNPKKIEKLTKESYHPAGMTALYDAIGMSVTRLQDEIGKDIRKNKTNAVIVIITDGYENSSVKYNFEQIRNLIAELESTGRYTFSYLGATLDAIKRASDLNINVKNSMSFSKEDFHESTSTLNKSYEEMAKLKSMGGNSYSEFLIKDFANKLKK